MSNFEQNQTHYTGLLSLCIIILVAVILWQLGLSLVGLVICCVLLSIVLLLGFRRQKMQLVQVFSRANWQLEAIFAQDYNQQIKAQYQAGEAALFEQNLIALSEYLHQNRSRYNSQVFIIYQLIDKLDIPVMVFDQDHSLSYSNNAFEHLYQQPWQTMKGASLDSLQLTCKKHVWQFTNSQLAKQWQLHSSQFKECEAQYVLLIASNIRQRLRENELQAWQQLIRVISHEINNSLTPVSSLAQSLSAKMIHSRDIQALHVIKQRCEHLQTFVGRYTKASEYLEISPKVVKLQPILEHVVQLFPEQSFKLDCHAFQCKADQQLLQQVLINVCKNAIESQQQPNTHIDLSSGYSQEKVIISIRDYGAGFANLDNVFTPFYSTKHTGQGIGLTLSRNIIEQHNGELILENMAKGAQVTIILPH
jgi:nitrogen fixation/metabolism regulation signal transduction histidine kinase